MDWVAPLAHGLFVLLVPLTVIVLSGAVGRIAALILSTLLMIFGLCTAWVFALEGAVLALASLLYLRPEATWKGFALTSAGLCLLPLAVSWSLMANEFRAYERADVLYPPEDLRPRLSYETAVSDDGYGREMSAVSGSPIRLGSEPELGLKKVDDASGSRYFLSRIQTLQEVHERTYLSFAVALGFGPVRMMRLRPENIELPSREAKPLVCERTGPTDQPAPPQPGRETLLKVHWGGAGNFLDRERMGFVPERGIARGFVPHAMSEQPRKPLSHEPWQVTQLQLVSLWRFGEPRVYESDDLPNLEELSSETIPTRELDAFELAALSLLETEQDLVLEDAPGTSRIRMVGALRASETCQQCHTVQQGALLGAFSYELRPRLLTVADGHPDHLPGN
ncbi:MAG: hypothetical protein ACK5Q5_14265 [Planctomycetaceae bacterium]